MTLSLGALLLDHFSLFIILEQIKHLQILFPLPGKPFLCVCLHALFTHFFLSFCSNISLVRSFFTIPRTYYTSCLYCFFSIIFVIVIYNRSLQIMACELNLTYHLFLYIKFSQRQLCPLFFTHCLWLVFLL